MILHKWGLTGGIGAGKSVAAEAFKKLGVDVIDLDALGRKLMEEDQALLQAVQNLFSEDVVQNGKLNRTKVRNLIFQNQGKRIELEKLLHPRILASFEEQASQAFAKGKKMVLCEAALLIESGYADGLDGQIVVTAPLELRKQRLIERDGISPELAEKIIQSQVSDEERLKKATTLLLNVTTKEALAEQVGRIVEDWKRKAIL